MFRQSHEADDQGENLMAEKGQERGKPPISMGPRLVILPRLGNDTVTVPRDRRQFGQRTVASAKI
jgi:hypothetical protein